MAALTATGLVLNQAGLGTTLPYLDDLTARWEADGASAELPLWREAGTLSEHMLLSWPHQTWRRSETDSDAARMLELQTRLGKTGHIDTFLAEQSAEGNYAPQDNAAIVRAAALLPPARATELLVRILGRNTVGQVGACSNLVLLCVSAPSGSVGDALKLGAALLDGLPGDPARFAGLETWQRPAPPRPDAVVDLLSAVSRIEDGLAMRVAKYLLTWPKTYRPGHSAGSGGAEFRGENGERSLAGGRATSQRLSGTFGCAHRVGAGGASGLEEAKSDYVRLR